MRYFLILSILVISPSAFSSIEECSIVRDDVERLECYDSYFNSPMILKDSKDFDEPIKSLELNDLSSATIEDRLLLKEKELFEKEERLEKKEKELLTEDERRWFGFTKRIKEKNVEEEEIKISSQIETVATKVNFQLLIILENGQHWQSVEKFRRHKLKDGYDVEITRGFLSGFALRVPGTKIKIRVRRTK